MPILLANFLYFLVFALWLCILARVLITWVSPGSGGGLVAFLYQVTEPILAPIRRVLPPTGGMDWSPLIASLLLVVVLRLIDAFARAL